MTARAKFLFDADFGVAKEQPRRVTVEEHEAALKAAEQRGYARGTSAAEAQARTEAQRRMAASCERIGAALSAIASEMKAIQARVSAESVEVAMACARKLAAALIAREPLAEISALANDCIGALTTAPHIVVRVSNELYDETRERLEEIAHSRGYQGRLVVLGEPAIRPGDCRIEWADGGMIRDRATIEAAIDNLVSRYVAALQAR